MVSVQPAAHPPCSCCRYHTVRLLTAHHAVAATSGCHMTPAGEPFAAAIDGQDGSSWRLPLPPLTASSSPEAYSPGENPPLDRLQAAARLVGGLPRLCSMCC
eukprot:GHRR01022110.1.p1 GENE.GHRR01022110.1~~GHRR01022110.1.p1  ORF type:complete len:102 (-),score=25.11 GHRR01022110.1:602-907(-)